MLAIHEFVSTTCMQNTFNTLFQDVGVGIGGEGAVQIFLMPDDQIGLVSISGLLLHY